MQSMLLITWASNMSKEQDKLLCDFKVHVDDPLEADPQFCGHSSRDTVLSSVSCGPSHNPAMAADCNHSIASVSRVTLWEPTSYFSSSFTLHIFSWLQLSSNYTYFQGRGKSKTKTKQYTIQADENTSLNGQLLQRVSLVLSISCEYTQLFDTSSSFCKLPTSPTYPPSQPSMLFPVWLIK